MAHLDAVHRSTIAVGGEPSAWLEKLTQWAYHEWAIEWKPFEEIEGKEEMKHCSQVKLDHKMTLFGKLNILNLKVSFISLLYPLIASVTTLTIGSFAEECV